MPSAYVAVIVAARRCRYFAAPPRWLRQLHIRHAAARYFRLSSYHILMLLPPRYYFRAIRHMLLYGCHYFAATSCYDTIITPLLITDVVAAACAAMMFDIATVFHALMLLILLLTTLAAIRR